MSKKPETIFAEKYDALLNKTFGHDIEIENIQQVSKRGTPDRLICLLGQHVAIEYKTDEGTPDKLQLLKLAKYKRAYGFTAIVTPTTAPFVLMELVDLHKKAKKIYGYV